MRFLRRREILKNYTGKIMVSGKQRMPNVSNFFVKHTHTIHRWKGIFDILRLNHTGFQGVFMKLLSVEQSTQTVCILQLVVAIGDRVCLFLMPLKSPCHSKENKLLFSN